MGAHATPSRVAGRVRAPPSKSCTHRAVLIVDYSNEAVARDALVSANTKVTMHTIETFGGPVDCDDQAAEVAGFGSRPGTPDDTANCENSGTTVRLVTDCAALGEGLTILAGDASLRSRPHGPLLDAVFGLDGRTEDTYHNGQASLVVSDGMTDGTVKIPGGVSSQFVTALLMTGAVTKEGIDVGLTMKLKSSPYVDITLELLADFGVEATWADAGSSVPGGQSYIPEGGAYSVPGDFLSPSYLFATGTVAGTKGKDVVIEGARPSAQGDSAIVDIVRDVSATMDWNGDAGELVVSTADLTGTIVDVGDMPDLLSTIAVLGAIADGDTVIENCEHVRLKGTDRVSAMAEELAETGASVTEQRDRLAVHGGETNLVGTAVGGRDDHRTVMSLVVTGPVAGGEATIAGSEHADVSFPNFFETMRDLGAKVTEHWRRDPTAASTDETFFARTHADGGMLDADAQALRERRLGGEYLLPTYDSWCFSRIPETVVGLPGADAGPRLPTEMTDGYDGMSRVVVHRDLGVWYGDEDGGKLGFATMYGGLHPDEMLIPFATATIDSLR